MKKHIRFTAILYAAAGLAFSSLYAQVPVANFSINPNPVCSGAVVQITDLSSNSPTSWSYTLTQGGPGNPGQTSSAQNPTVAFNNAGTFTISLIATNNSGSSTVVTHTISVLASPNAIINPATQNSCIGGNPVTINCQSFGAGGASITYSWSNGPTTQSISVTPSTTTVYTCVVTSTNGCSVSRSGTVNITTPTVNMSSNPVNICPGSSSTLTANSSGPGPWTYSWSTAATTNTIVTSTAGVYTVAVTNANNCTGTQTYSLGTSSTLSLTTSSTPSVLCAGNTATLHVTGASSYNWSSGAATANATVNPSANTTYTVTGTVGTCTGSAVITLSVNTTPTIVISSSTTSLCAGQSVNLSATGANSFTWNPGTVVSPSLVASPSVTTTYSVRGLNPGCNARTATISIAVLPSPTLVVSSSATLVCAGEDVALAASGASSYSWSTGASTGVILVNPTITTVYTVVGTGNNGCSTTSQITQNVSDCTNLGTNSSPTQVYQIYPNPSQGTFVLSSATNAKLSILNETGAIVKVILLNESNDRSVSVSDLSAGIYFVVNSDTGPILKQKIIVLK